MKKAIIDIGTNTFHLLIADMSDGINILHDEKVAVRIGQSGISRGEIAPDAITRAIITLRDFRQKMTSYGVSEEIVTATSAVRSAKNKVEFLSLVKNATNMDIHVLDGIQEATLIYKGVSKCIDLGQESALIVDIGGGSIEFIIANEKEIKWLRSYEIGGQRIMDQYHKSDPILDTEIEALEKFLDDTIHEVFLQCKQYEVQYLIGSSGSFDTFWDIYCSKKYSNIVDQKPVIKMSQFMTIYKELTTKSSIERLQMPGMVSMRVDMIVGAGVVTKKIMVSCKFDYMKISSFALKEGLLYYGLPN